VENQLNNPCGFTNRDQTITAYLRNELSEKDEVQFEQHYMGCEDCRLELRIRKQMFQVSDEIPIATESYEQQPNESNVSWYRGFGWAAAILLMGAIGIMQFFATPTAVDYTAQMEPNTFMEQLTQQKWRSISIDKVSPANGDTLTEALEFNWEFPGNQPVQFELFSNEPNMIFSKKIEKSSFLLNPTEQNLLPGRYYWKLIYSESPVYIGSFVYLP